MIIKERIVYDMVASDSYYRGEALKGNALMEISEESKEAVRDLISWVSITFCRLGRLKHKIEVLGSQRMWLCCSRL